ncbi:hypothetical protein Tco_0328201 [Tanacetum coccineum]
MTTTATQQFTLDNALISLEKQVKIGKCNMRIDPAKTQKEPTYQVVLDALALTTCYPAFFITIDVLEIYMQQFWFTINRKYSTTYKFKIDKKSYRIDIEVFIEIFHICLRLPNKDFHENRQMMKLSPSLRNLATKETLNLSLKWSLIRCTNHGELLLQSSTSAYLEKLRVLTSFDFQELKFYGECSIRRMLILSNYFGRTSHSK